MHVFILQGLRCSLYCAQVLLGHAYDMAIDMWSLGCMAAELFLGLPLFPGASEHDLLVRIVDMLGMPPDHVLQKAQHTNRCPSLLPLPLPRPLQTPLCMLLAIASLEVVASGIIELLC